MNENIDLTKILDGCPKGTKFYHAGYGRVVKFVDIDLSSGYPIQLALHNNSSYNYANLAVTEKGTINADYEGECLLFPSKDQRDWSKFERFWDKPKKERFDPKTFQPFDKVLGFYEVEGGNWECALFSHLNVKDRSAVCTGIIYNKCIPYNEKTKHLVGTNDDCPEYYKWWEE